MITKYEKYPKYKNSGVEWIGEIPEGWEVKKIKYTGNIFPGLNGKKGDDFSKIKKEKLKPFIPFTNICNNIVIKDNQFQYVRVLKHEQQNKIKQNDILFLMSSETNDDIAKCSIYLGKNKELYLNSFCKGFRIKDINVLPLYINYLFLSLSYRKYFSMMGRGFTRINLKQEYINDTYSILPPLPEQTAIANFLDDKTTKIDQAISQKQKLIELLKERKQIIIQNAVTKGLNPNAKLKNSGVDWIGDIPEHWEVKRLGHLLKPYSIKNKPNEKLLSITRELGVIERDLDNLESNHNFIPDDLSGYKLIFKGDFGMNKMKAWQGSFGVSNYTGIVSPAYYTFNLTDNINPDFFHIAIRSKFYVHFFGSASDGVRIGQWDLSKDRMKNISFLIPPLSEQKQIVSYIETETGKIDKAINLQEQQIEKLKEYKTVLIDSAVTGKIKVINN